MKQLFNFLIGLVLCGFGVFLLLSNISVDSISFYSYNGISTAPMLIILLIVIIICTVVKNEWYCYLLLFLDVIAMIVSVILGTRFRLRSMSAFDLVIMIVVFSVGLGLVIKSLIGLNNSDKKGDK